MATLPLSIFTTFKKSENITKNVEEIVNVPQIIIVNKFDEESAKKFNADFCIAENSNQEIIPIFIDSYGGEVYSLLSMIDCIKSSKKKIATICIGKSMSCGAVLLTCGTAGYRYASSRGTIMIHDVSNWCAGKIEELKSSVNETERLGKLVLSIMDSNCEHEDGYFEKNLYERKHSDWFLTAEEAKNNNIINHIKIPKFEVSVSAEIKFC